MAGAGVGHIDGGSNGGLLGVAGDGNRVCSAVSAPSHVGQVWHVGGTPASVGRLEAGLSVGTVVDGTPVGAVDAGEPVGASGAGVGLSGQSAPALPVLADGAASGVHGKSLSSKWLIAKKALGQDSLFFPK